MNMGKWTVFCAAGAMACGAMAANDKYVDWQWKAVEVQDKDADSNVRNQMDFTVPVHGPWLTLPSETGMTVTWITRVNCAGGIAYREKGATNWVERWPVACGLIDYSKDVHCHHLSGLKPATEYEYQLLSNMSANDTAYHMILARSREIRSFKTLDQKRQNYKVFLTSDFHGGGRLCIDPMIDRSGAADADFFFFLGDNVEDGMYNDIRYFTTFGFLDDVTRKWGQFKPTIFMRGNHDIAGRDAGKYGEYFPQPDGKTYYAFRQGPCFFVAIDTLWPRSEKLQQEQYLKYLAEQAEWLKNLKRSKDWQASVFRVVMFHVPMFPGEGMKDPYKFFGEILADESKEGRVHAVLAGHEHEYARVNPNTKETRVAKHLNRDPKKYPSRYLKASQIPDRFPYVSVLCNLCEAMTIQVSPEKLEFRSHDVSTAEGKLFDAFAVHPDGKVEDLIETTAFPFGSARR